MRLFPLIFLALMTEQAFSLSHSVPALGAEFDAVAWLSLDAKDKDGDLVGGLCVGTFVNPQVAVTAAHCVGPTMDLGIRTVTVRLGTYNYVTNPRGETVRTGWKARYQAKLPARFYILGSTKPGPNEDMAIIVFDHPLPFPEGTQFVETVSTNEGAIVTGSIANYAPSIVTVNLVEEMSTDTRRIATLTNLSPKGNHFESQSTSRVQPGDSGAPMFVRIGTKWKLMGVVKGRAETFFSNWDVISNLSKGLCALAAKAPAHKKDLCH